MGIRILGTGSYLPENKVENEAFTSIIETSDEWIVKHSGIKTRRFNAGATYELALHAAEAALESAALTPLDIDLILCTTASSDYYSPSLACIIQGRLGASNAMALDVSAACAGFVFGLDMAHLYLQNGYRRVLLISAESLTKITDFTDRSTCVLFGDGAGAVVMEADDRPFASVLRTDGTGANLLFARRPEHEIPFIEQIPLEVSDGYTPCTAGTLHMDGPKVYKFAVTVMPQMVRESSEKYGIAPEDLDWIIPHQANLRIIQTAVAALKLPPEKFICNIDEYANMSSACIPIALDQAVRDGRVKRGQKICAVGFGAGLVYGGVVFEY